MTHIRPAKQHSAHKHTVHAIHSTEFTEKLHYPRNACHRTYVRVLAAWIYVVSIHCALANMSTHQSGSISVKTRILQAIQISMNKDVLDECFRTHWVFFVSSISWKITQPERGLRVKSTE